MMFWQRADQCERREHFDNGDSLPPSIPKRPATAGVCMSWAAGPGHYEQLPEGQIQRDQLARGHGHRASCTSAAASPVSGTNCPFYIKTRGTHERSQKTPRAISPDLSSSILTRIEGHLRIEVMKDGRQRSPQRRRPVPRPERFGRPRDVQHFARSAPAVHLYTHAGLHRASKTRSGKSQERHLHPEPRGMQYLHDHIVYHLRPRLWCDQRASGRCQGRQNLFLRLRASTDGFKAVRRS